MEKTNRGIYAMVFGILSIVSLVLCFAIHWKAIPLKDSVGNISGLASMALTVMGIIYGTKGIQDPTETNRGLAIVGTILASLPALAWVIMIVNMLP